MNAAKLAQMNAMHMERKSYEEPSPQMGSLPPPSTLAHQHFLKQMQRQYAESVGKPDIGRDPLTADEPLDLGKERPRDDCDRDRPPDERDYPSEPRYRSRSPDEPRAPSAPPPPAPLRADEDDRHADS
ncbi:hypothetical protein EVAR_38808_1 [Eumeta japonica]|uniref:Uncharacterized protein n=1 Tax=Eumeta variegata TaxID=151549 RepID=A0A4C1WMR6_EUMVA|nr:hypothetical protein EVAR_38808_1 [Eumeta japonica]